jgi:hypothetical protein
MCETTSSFRLIINPPFGRYHMHDIRLQDLAGIDYISGSADNSFFVAI